MNTNQTAALRSVRLPLYPNKISPIPMATKTSCRMSKRLIRITWTPIHPVNSTPWISTNCSEALNRNNKSVSTMKLNRPLATSRMIPGIK